MIRELLTLDASSRVIDQNGYMRVGPSNIAKAGVNEYYGREIPGWEEQGLERDKIYKVLRPPEELKKAVNTFNGAPLLIIHKPDSAKNPQKELRVGVTGTEARFEDPYIKNTLVFHDAKAIELVNTKKQEQLSPGYSYRPVFEPGEFDGEKYDLWMADIVCNHEAIVEEGRQGPDVKVADENSIGERKTMKRWLKMLLAMDSTPEEVKEELMDAIEKLDEMGTPADSGETLDKDMPMDDALAKLNELLAPLTEGHEQEGKAIQAILDVIANRAAAPAGGDDEPVKAADNDKPEGAKDNETKEQAQDKRPVYMVDTKAIEQRVLDKVNAENKAKELAADEVRPLVGSVRISAFDSAAGIYGFALDKLEIDKSAHEPSSYRAVVAGLKHGKTPSSAPVMAEDSKDTGPLKGIDLSRFGVR